MVFRLYVDHKPLASFLVLQDALDAWWPFIQERRSAFIVKMPHDMVRTVDNVVRLPTVN